MSEKSLDALAEVLRMFGKFSFPIKHNFEMEGAREQFESWSGHLLTGTPHPDHPEKKAFKMDERDWNGSIQFFQKYRTAEKNFVEKAIGEQKEVIWSFVKQLGNMAQEDTESNKNIVGQLDSLLKASQSGDVESMQKETQNSVGLIVKTFKEREERNQKVMTGINQRILQLEEELATTKKAASIDPLTKVYTRGSFDEKLKDTVAHYKRSGLEAALFFFDVDKFKQVNDEFGHQVGDEVLKKIARTIIGILMRETDTVARYGGDEFAAIMANTDLDEAKNAGERIVAAVAELMFGPPTVKTSVSVGLSIIKEGDDSTTWLKRADQAVYKAKESGRNNLKIEN